MAQSVGVPVYGISLKCALFRYASRETIRIYGCAAMV
jgi:hypothetical protein